MPQKRELLHQIIFQTNPTWSLDEGEEMHRDINDLQKKAVTKYELQGMMDSTEANLEAIMDTKMYGLKRKIM